MKKKTTIISIHKFRTLTFCIMRLTPILLWIMRLSLAFSIPFPLPKVSLIYFIAKLYFSSKEKSNFIFNMQLFKNGFTYVSTFVVCNNSFYMFQVSNPKNLSIKHMSILLLPMKFNHTNKSIKNWSVKC